MEAACSSKTRTQGITPQKTATVEMNYDGLWYIPYLHSQPWFCHSGPHILSGGLSSVLWQWETSCMPGGSAYHPTHPQLWPVVLPVQAPDNTNPLNTWPDCDNFTAWIIYQLPVMEM
jgi:hypothetical protein